MSDRATKKLRRRLQDLEGRLAATARQSRPSALKRFFAFLADFSVGLALGAALFAAYYIAPTISPMHVDPGDPLFLPLKLTNSSYFDIAVSDVRCLATAEYGGGRTKFEGVDVSASGAGILPAQESRNGACSIASLASYGDQRIPDPGRMDIQVTYRLKRLRRWPFDSHVSRTLFLVRNSTGYAWVEDRALGDD